MEGRREGGEGEGTLMFIALEAGASLSFSLQSFDTLQPVYTANICLLNGNFSLLCQASHYSAEPTKTCLSPGFHAS